MNIGLAIMNLVPKSIRQTLRESLRIVLREELQAILEQEELYVSKESTMSNPRLVAQELGALLEQRLLPHYSDVDHAGGDFETQAISRQEVYAPPKTITDLDECYFYHTMDIPEYGHVEGEWDLQGHEFEYLGGVNLDGKRVLELGTASGFLCFYMENQGAEVVAYDLSEEQVWDIIPFSGYDSKQIVLDFKTHINPNSLETLTSCRVEPSLAGAKPGSHYQFERLGYFCVDSVDSSDSRIVFNRAATLRDQWAKIEKTLKK